MKFRGLIIGYIAVMFSACLSMNGYAKGDKEKVCPQVGKCDLKLYVVATSQDASQCRSPILTTDESGSVEFENMNIAANIIFRDVDIDITIPRGQPYTLSKDSVFFTNSNNGVKEEKKALDASALGIKVNVSNKDASIKFKRNMVFKTEFFFGVYLEFPGVSKCKVDPKIVNGQ